MKQKGNEHLTPKELSSLGGRSSSKLTYEQVIEIKKLLREKKMNQKEIANIYGVAKRTISDINTGRNWKYVE